MSHIRRIALAIAGLVLALTAATIAGTSPAHAQPPNPPCEWEPGKFGDVSECDGLAANLSPHYPYCGPSQEKDRVTIGPTGGPGLAFVTLEYFYGGGNCRTIAAAIYLLNPEASCYARIYRNSDGERQYFYNAIYGVWRFTPVVYDADVTSYAWGSCIYHGATYNGPRTRNY